VHSDHGYRFGVPHHGVMSRAASAAAIVLPLALLLSGLLAAPLMVAITLAAIALIVAGLWHAARTRVVLEKDTVVVWPLGWFSPSATWPQARLVAGVILSDHPTMRLELMLEDEQPIVLGPFDYLSKRSAERRLSELASELQRGGLSVADTRNIL
jgi:hypothetical protein